MVRLEMDTLTAPPFTAKTEEEFWPTVPPFTVTPAGGPVMAVVDEMDRLLLFSVIVWGVEKVELAKVMLPAPSAAAAASASRRLQFGVPAPVQLAASPEASSAVVVTTKVWTAPEIVDTVTRLTLLSAPKKLASPA